MLFMVIERFKQGDPRDPQPIRERFARQGRMLPDGLMYHASWVDTTGRRCYQVREASQVASPRALDGAVEVPDRLEVVPVLTSADFWPTVTLKPA
jgi:hypothetical protein